LAAEGLMCLFQNLLRFCCWASVAWYYLENEGTGKCRIWNVEFRMGCESRLYRDLQPFFLLLSENSNSVGIYTERKNPNEYSIITGD